MRTRQGETALSIAVRKGLRPIVTTLVSRGATTHCRDYSGGSILRNARKHLRRAMKQDNDRVYASVMSCIIYLIDTGAVETPND